MASTHRSRHFVCMPTFSLAALLLIVFKRNNGLLPVVLYDTLPRYLRAIGRILRVSEAAFISLLGSISGIVIISIQHGDQVAGYPNLHIDAMQRTSCIAEGLSSWLKDEYLVRKLGELLGADPALAFALKHVAHVNIFHNVLALFSSHQSVPRNNQLILVWDMGCPEEWYPLISQELKDIPFVFHRWPAWLRSLAAAFHQLSIAFISLAELARWILSRRVVYQVKANHYELISEFIDPKRIGRTAYDADYWIDGMRVHPEKVLFFLTRSQRLQLKRDGYRLDQIENMMQSKGYQMAVLDRLPYSWRSARSLCCFYISAVSHLSVFLNPIAATLFYSALMNLLEFAPLLEHFTATGCVYVTFPNGHTGFRTNDAIVTGLCRRHSVRSIGCQTRALYSTKYEYCFDCFDTYLAWGPAWHAALPQRLQFVKEISTVGCISLDSLLPIWPNNSTLHDRKSKKRLVVSIFPSDMGQKHHYTSGYTTRLLTFCARIASNHRDVRFIVKMKDPEYILQAMRNVELAHACRLVEDNFEIPTQSRYNYSEILQASDIVIAIGYTTPGTEALLLGKRAIFYSELTCAGQPFRHIPSLIATSEEELNILFDEALRDHVVYCENNYESIALLDPFRDGHALSRITTALQT